MTPPLRNRATRESGGSGRAANLETDVRLLFRGEGFPRHGPVLSDSWTARNACVIALFVSARAPASELAMAIRPKGCRPTTHGFSASDFQSGSQSSPGE